MKKMSKKVPADPELNSNASPQKPPKMKKVKGSASPLPAKRTPVLQKKKHSAGLNPSAGDVEETLSQKNSHLNLVSEKVNKLNSVIEKQKQEVHEEQAGSNAADIFTSNTAAQNVLPQMRQLQGNFLDELLQKTPKVPAFNEVDKRTPTNESLLKLQKPGLLLRQAEFLNGSVEERRHNYIKGGFIELKNIAPWNEQGQRLMNESKSQKSVSKAKTVMKKSFLSRGSSVPPKAITPEYDFNPKLNAKISIYKGDIATLELDAVVVTAGATFQKTSMSSSVFEGAGAELAEEIKVYRQNQNVNINPIVACQAIVFAGYRLPALYTIHVIYPGKDMDGEKQKLCYENALNAAVKFKLKSVAIPCIGTGGYGYPSDKACKIALDTVRNWLETPEGETIERVVFCCYKDQDFLEYKSSTFIYFPINEIPKDEIVSMKSYFGPEVTSFDVTKLKDLCQRISQSYKALDFSDCGDCVTDFAFWILNHYSDGGYQKVKSIDCTGCNSLTDNAMFAISGCFSNLEQISLYTVSHSTSAAEQKNASHCTTYKVIFLRHFGMQHKTPSMISQLVGKVGKDSNVSQEWKGMLRYEQKVTSDGSTMNMYEIDASLLEFIGTERSIIVLPSLVIDSGPSFKMLLSTAIALGKGAPIISMSPGATKTVKTWIDKVEGRIREEVMQKLNLFQTHDSLISANLFSLRFWLKQCQIYETKAGNPLITNLNSKEWKTAMQFVDDRVPYLNALPADVIKSAEEVVKRKVVAKLDFRLASGFSASILMGNVLRFPKSYHVFNMQGKGTEIIKVFNVLFSQNKLEKTKLIPWLPNDSMAVSLRSFEANVKQHWGMNTIECENLLDALESCGVFYAVVLPWMNAHVPRPALIPSGSFFSEPPIEPETIWQDYWNDDEQELCLLYSMPFHPSALFMQMLFRSMIKLSFPVLVWRYGIICHIGSQEIYIKLDNASDSDAFSLFVGIRGMNFRESSGKKKADNDPFQVWQKYDAAKTLKQSMGQVFQLVRQIVDVTLIESGTYAMPQLRCPYCRVKDRIHYYDVQKVTSNSTDPIKCHTFKEQIPYDELFIDSYFDTKCAHFTDENVINSSTHQYDQTYRCSMCWAAMSTEIDYTCGGKTSIDSTCMQCHMCKNCIYRIQKDHTVLSIKPWQGTGSRQSLRMQSEVQGFECALCSYKFPSQDILVKHMAEWCPYRLRKLIQKDQDDEKAGSLGRIISVKNVPKTVQFCLNDNFCNSVDVMVIKNPDAIFLSGKQLYKSLATFAVTSGKIISSNFVRKYDSKAVQFSVDGNMIHESTVSDTYAIVTLVLTEAKACIMILPQNRNLVPMQYPLRKRMYLEFIYQEKSETPKSTEDKERLIALAQDIDNEANEDKTSAVKSNQTKVYLAFIDGFDKDGKITLNFEDYNLNEGENIESLKFHGFITDWRLHPLGWSDHYHKKFNLILPDAAADKRSEQHFDYIKFLDQKASSSVPMSFFSGQQAGAAVDPVTTYLKKFSSTTTTSIKVGMKLEAVDRKNRHLTCVATIQAVLPGRVEIYFDGWTHNFDYTTDFSHTDLRPIGYCDSHGIALQPPKGYGKQFDWVTYLRETESDPVPHNVFSQDQIDSTPLHPVYRGFKSRVDIINDAKDKEVKAPPPDLPHFIKFHKLFATRQDLTTFSTALEMVGFQRDSEVSIQAIPYFVPLPTHISAATLLYPSRKLALDWTVGKQTLHGLCAHNDNDETSILAVGSWPWNFILSNRFIIRSSAVYLHMSTTAKPLDQTNLLTLSQTTISEQLVENGTKSGDVHLYTTKYKTKVVESIHYLFEAVATVLYDSMKVLLLNKVSAKGRICISKEIDTAEELEGVCRYMYLNLANLFLLTQNSKEQQSHKFLLQVAQWFLGKYKLVYGVTVSADICPLRPQADHYHKMRVLQNVSLVRAIIVNDKPNRIDNGNVCTFESMAEVMQKLGKNVQYPHVTLICARMVNDLQGSKENKLALIFELIKKCPNLKLLLLVCPWNKELHFLDNGHLQDSLVALSMNMRLQTDQGLQSIFSLQELRHLHLEHCAIEQIPESITNLRKLEYLHLGGNLYSKVPDCIKQLKSVRFLDMSATALFTKNHAPCTIDDIYNRIDTQNIPLIWDFQYKADALEMIHNKANEFGIKGLKGTPVEEEHIEQLNTFMSSLAPRIQDSGLVPQDSKTQANAVFQLPRLQELHLNYHAIDEIPQHVQHLKNLSTFSLKYCKKLTSISQHMGKLEKLKTIDLEGCTSLRTPPPEVVRRGSESVMAYLKRLLSGFRECKRTKLMLVGLGGAGKTSLVRALLSGKYQSEGTTAAEITDGIDIVDWSVRVNVTGYDREQTINYSIWDFAGQSVYYNTHQFFLSNRAVYLLLWNTRLGYEHAGLDFWLSSITCHAPKAPIFVVGTHADQVHHADLPETELKQTFPQIAHFCLISALIGQGVESLAETLYQITLEQKYMGERIPSIWLNLENHIISQRSRNNIIATKEVEKTGLTLGLLDMAEVSEALTFLHELGSLQYFSNEFLRDQVVINPQWLVDVMACLVTVKESVIKEGRFNREDIGVIWQKYDKALHEWLLQLTEEFDLTYALPTDDINVVPCLLPEQEPLYDWPEIIDDSMKEMKMTYHFEYLPAGLFNRTQTRLCQYADSSVVWKKGSMLRKNQHIALIRQSRDKELIVKVQGPRPGNVLFLVHEVISTLVHQFFQGVSYDLFIPCSDCVKSGSQDPNMFSAKQVKRAADMKAPFLQCSKNFHIVALGALQEFIPPSTVNDFDTHLSGVMHDLKQLKSNFGSSVLLLCCRKDLKGKVETENGTMNPKTLVADLKKAKINIQIFDGLGKGGKQSGDAANELAELLNKCAVAIACISDSFCKDKNSTDLFTFFKRGSHRPIIPVVISSGEEWKNTGVGMLVTTEMFVDMRKMNRYKQKLQELISRLNSKLNICPMPSSGGVKQKHEIFFSYCWSNSHDAIKKGSKAVDGSLGEVDPRDIDEYLTENSQKVWLDLRCAKEGVLFEEIAEALRGAKLMIACVSDQYLASRNCMLEYRFASGILKIPLILCVVGTGTKWHISEITMLALSAPRVDFQTKNNSAFTQLLKYVDNILVEERGTRPKTAPSDNKADKQAADDKNYAAYAELRELAQRKFVDEVSILDANLKQNEAGFSTPYPRLFFMDVAEHINIDDYQVKKEKIRVKRRPTSATSVVSETAADEQLCIDFTKITVDNMCFKLLCEWDGEWHCVGQPIPFPSGWNNDAMAHMMTLTAPFLAKIYSILQHSPVSVKILEGEKSDTLLSDLKRIAEEKSTYGDSIQFAYRALVKILKEADADLQRGGMLRSSLHSRRILWLCPDHQKKARATIPNDAIDTDEVIVELDTGGPSFSNQYSNFVTPIPASGPSQENNDGHAAVDTIEEEVLGDDAELISNQAIKTNDINNHDHELLDRDGAETGTTGLTENESASSSRSHSSLSKIRSKMCIIS